MQPQFDAQQIWARIPLFARALRQSEAYPAIVGGIAGGIAGALMAILIAGRRTGRATALREQPTESKTAARFDLSVRDAIQLVTIVASLVKQIQAMAKK